MSTARNNRGATGRSAGILPARLRRQDGGATKASAPSLTRGERGSVLLLVLWLTAALSFVGLSMALSARTELAATRYRLEAEQARFLARGALEQAFCAMRTGLFGANGKPLFDPEKGAMEFAFQTGTARVTFRPEGSLLNVNMATAEQLRALLRAAGADDAEAVEMTMAILDWRTPRTSDAPTAFDRYYARQLPPYHAAHAPFTRLEELLLVKGMTPEFFYGWLERDERGGLVRRGGLNRLLTASSVYGIPSLNDSPYEVLLTAPGMRADQAREIVEGRRTRRYLRMEDLPVRLEPTVAENVALLGAFQAVRFEATATAAGSPVRATVRAVYERDPMAPGAFRVVSWEEQAASEEAFDLGKIPAGAGSTR